MPRTRHWLADRFDEDELAIVSLIHDFGLAISEPCGEAQVCTPCHAAVTEQLARGWMSLAGAMGGLTVVRS